jgi:hypothetical protein
MEKRQEANLVKGPVYWLVVTTFAAMILGGILDVVWYWLPSAFPWVVGWFLTCVAVRLNVIGA